MSLKDICNMIGIFVNDPKIQIQITNANLNSSQAYSEHIILFKDSRLILNDLFDIQSISFDFRLKYNLCTDYRWNHFAGNGFNFKIGLLGIKRKTLDFDYNCNYNYNYNYNCTNSNLNGNFNCNSNSTKDISGWKCSTLDKFFDFVENFTTIKIDNCDYTNILSLLGNESLFDFSSNDFCLYYLSVERSSYSRSEIYENTFRFVEKINSSVVVKNVFQENLIDKTDLMQKIETRKKLMDQNGYEFPCVTLKYNVVNKTMSFLFMNDIDILNEYMLPQEYVFLPFVYCPGCHCFPNGGMVFQMSNIKIN